MIKVLFVCLGNICRSPMAQFVFQNIVDKMSYGKEFKIDSRGTEKYNEITHADIHPGTKQILKANNIPFCKHYARVITKSDYSYYDYILVMEQSNIWDVKDIIGEDIDHKIHLLMDYSKQPRNIADPWYTGNFQICFQDVLEGCQGFFEWLKKEKLIK